MWNVVGHQAAIALLQRSLEKGSVAHAYLLVGPTHVGKMTLAVNLAQAVNCESVERPCGQCVSCQRIMAGKHADVQVIKLEQGVENETSAKTRISVEQIDQILHSVNLPPFEGNSKVFIIDGFEYLSIAAANRLLKTLEEPVSKTIFILLTADESMVPVTIISRCQRIELSHLPSGEIENALISHWQVEPQKARLLARLSQGCPGWAVNMVQDESLLEQRNGWLNEWLEMMAADNNQRFVFTAKMTERFGQHRETVQKKLDLLLDWWHDVLLVKTGNDGEMMNIDREDVVRQMAKSHSIMQIRNFIGRIQSAEKQLRLNVNPQLVLEVLMLNIPESVKVKSPTS